LKPISTKTLRGAALVAQWRAPDVDRQTIKAARLARCVETVEPLIRRYVTAAELQAIQKRGCVHSADFPEKRDASLRHHGGG
jgi:hypothetical protein